MFVYIYKLIKKDALNDDMVYIGSTENINVRMSRHKINCNNIKSHKYNYKVYKYIRDNGGWNEWTHEIIDEVEVALREDAARYEGEYIIKYDAINKLNDIVPGRTNKERYERNKVQIKQYQKEYREQNKEHLLQKQKEYRKQNKEQIKQNRKEKYQRNKENILQKKKEYHEQNKDDINQRRRERQRLAKLNTL